VKHTEGSWALARGGRSVNVGLHGKIRQEPGLPPDELTANMQLVSAAPELYECALDTLAFIETIQANGGIPLDECLIELERDVQAALAKAEGRS